MDAADKQSGDPIVESPLVVLAGCMVPAVLLLLYGSIWHRYARSTTSADGIYECCVGNLFGRGAIALLIYGSS